MKLIFGSDDFVAAWVMSRIGHPISPPYTAIGMTVDDAMLCGGVVFNDWNGANIAITVAVDRPPTRGIIRALQHYAFEQAGAIRISAQTRRANKRARKALERLGFEYEFVRQNYFGPAKGDDAFCYVLKKGKERFK